MVSNSIPTLFIYSPSQVPIFEGEHYDYWSSQMETFFISQDLWEIIEDGYAKSPETGSSSTWTPAQQNRFKENKKRDATALRFIQQGVSKSIYARIFGIKNSKLHGKF